MANDQPLTLESAADRLGITPSLVRRYLREGRIRGQKFGRAWSIKPSALATFAKTPRKPGPKKSAKVA